MNQYQLSRRQFLRRLVAGSAIMAGLPLLPGATLQAAGTVPRTLINLMLYGGADLRYLFAPDPLSANPVYVQQYWQARRALYDGSYSDYASMYTAEYTTVGSSPSFGILNSCGWLISEYMAGNVCIVANSYGSLNRSHDHSQLIINAGELNAPRTLLDRDGWGGRVAEHLGGLTNVLELSRSVSTFCKGTDPSARLKRVVHAKDTREMTLPQADPASSRSDDNLIRAINAYYRARGTEIASEKPTDWPYRKIFQHHESISAFGQAVTDALAATPMPDSLNNLNISGSFAQQCRNLFDACQLPDILHYRLMSMFYGGWDTHTGQTPRIESNLSDIFGSNGGLATVMAEIPSQAADNLTFHISWDFGRQIAANGSSGTDHGRANYTILVGRPTIGGTHGEMFPIREAMPEPGDSQGRTPFEIPGQDILGLSSLEHIWSAHAHWLGTDTAFPDPAGKPIEPGVDLTPASLYTS